MMPSSRVPSAVRTVPFGPPRRLPRSSMVGEFCAVARIVNVTEPAFVIVKDRSARGAAGGGDVVAVNADRALQIVGGRDGGRSRTGRLALRLAAWKECCVRDRRNGDDGGNGPRATD